ncbi:EAL domain-containing protein [Rheinheimera gaetbuli]
MNFLPQLWRYAAFFLLWLTLSVPATPLLRPLTPDLGLSQGSIYDLMLDQDGFLWVATAGGLNRFDGIQVTQPGTAQYNLRAVSFTRLLRDSNDQIFAASASGDIYRYQQPDGNMQLFSQLQQQDETLLHPFITGLMQYDDSSMLVTTANTLYQVSSQSGNAIKRFSLTELGHNDGWLRGLLVWQHYVLLAAFNGVIVYDMQTGQHQYLPHLAAAAANADTSHVKVLSIANERLWVGTVAGLYSISLPDVQAYLEHGTAYQTQIELAQPNIWQLLWQDDKLLIPTERGLLSYTPQTKDIETLVQFSSAGLGLFEDSILDIVADNEGGYWLASRDDGVYYWHPQSEAFSQLSRRNDSSVLSSDKVYSLLQDGPTLWVGTANGLNRLDENTLNNGQFLVSDDAKAVQHEGAIYRILPAGSHGLWLDTAVGLRYFDKQQLTQTAAPLADSRNTTLLDHFSYSYFQYGQHIYFFRQAEVFRYDVVTHHVKNMTAALPDFTVDSNSVILHQLTGPAGGLLLSKPDEIWLWQPDSQRSRLLFRHKDYQPHLNRIADTATTDSQNRLWVGMSGIGLLGFDLTSLQLQHTLNTGEKQVPDAIYDLQTATNGDIWFSSHQGLGKLNLQTLQIELFSRDDGLDTHEYNSGAVAVHYSGQLVYGSMRGLTFVATDKLAPQHNNNPVIITGISVLSGDFKPLQTKLNGRHLTLSHQDQGITLQFSAMSFSRNHKLKYRYWLSGSSELTYPLQRSSSIVFPQLNSGSYQFNVVAVSPETGEESPAASFTLTIKPAPWLSGWAISSYFLLLSLILFRFYRFRQKQQREVSAAHDKVKQSAQRLKQALASVNSGAFEWKAESNSLFAIRMHNMLGYAENMNMLTLQQHISLIHPDDLDKFNSRWQRFMQDPQQGFDCTYRLKHCDDNWLWFRDQGKATSSDSANRPLQMIGTFSNITETRANQEKARLFGEAFQQTRDWVVILDTQQRVMTANQSFCSAFGNMELYLDQPRTHHLGISLVRRRFYTGLLRDMTPGQHWQGEELVITPDGRERPTLINISAIAEPEQPTFYVLVFTDITAQKLAEDELRYLANYDALTGLPNRALLMDRIYHGIDQAKRDKRSLALCFIDLDKFKQINDSLGHDIGDLLLKEVARRLTLTLRDSDTVARLGGDEFVVLLEGYKAQDNISHVARKMLTIVSETMQFGTHTVGISPSIGIAVYPEDAINATELLKHADVAMYHAKEAGRNNFQFFTAEMNEKAHMRLARETRLRSALKKNEFINYYQPIVNSQTRQVVGAEVLLRWYSSDGLISPAEFIPLAEELRLIINMTNLLLERALKDLQQWHRNGHLIYLSVNISPQHLEQLSLAEHTKHLLKKYDIPASYLRFEVTENGLMRDHESAIETMLSLSFLGVQLALDDFGTGYSSLKYLKELPIDGIKIDRSFVQDIGIDNSDETIIEAMLSMANSLGMYCIAEGVETEQQLAFFSRRQCYLIQGYLFARPMPAVQMEDYLLQEH